jgi:hypothetical protein
MWIVLTFFMAHWNSRDGRLASLIDNGLVAAVARKEPRKTVNLMDEFRNGFFHEWWFGSAQA